MYNPNFDQKKFRDNIQSLNLLPRHEDRLVSGVGIRIASENQIFPEGFYNVRKTVRQIADKQGRSEQDILAEIVEDPTPLFAAHNIPVAKSGKTYNTEGALASVSPHLRLRRGARTAPVDVTKTFSEHTTSLLFIPAIEKTPPKTAFARTSGTKRRASPPAAKAPKERKKRESKPMPSYEAIAAAAHQYQEKHGKPPRGVGGNEFLPEGSPSWSTLVIHRLRGDNTLAKIMKRFPPEKPDAGKQGAQTPIAVASVETCAEPAAKTTKPLKACDVFNGLMFYASRKIIPSPDSPFQFVEGKSMKEIDSHFRSNDVDGVERYLSNGGPAQIKSLKDFMVAAGIVRREGKNIVLSPPADLRSLARTYG